MAFYPDFIETCGYGDVRGILGANCRHHFSPFVEGVSERTYTDAELEAMKGKNNKITFEGREYDGYESTQAQRKIERTIRKYKRRLLAYKALGTPEAKEKADAVQVRIRRLNEKYRAFSKAANLPTQLERVKVLYT